MTDVATFNNKPKTPIEKELGFAFISDPRGSRYPLPAIPEEFAAQHPGEPYSVPVDVTWEMAIDWLKYRVIREDRTPEELKTEGFRPNRSFIMGAIKGSPARKGWISIVRDEEVRLTHQGLAFTPTGFLSDGQHRLAAIALAQHHKPTRLMISVNVGWEGFTVMDSPRPRLASQLLGQEISEPLMVAASAKYVMPVLSESERWEYYEKLATKDQVIQLINATPYYRGPWAGEVKAAARGSHIPNTPLMASVVMALVAGADPFQVQGFLDGLKASANVKDAVVFGKNGDDPRWHLRRHFSGRSTGKRSHAAAETYGNVGLIRRAMNIWLDQEETGNFLRTPPSRPLPPVWNADAVREYYADRLGN